MEVAYAQLLILLLFLISSMLGWKANAESPKGAVNGYSIGSFACFVAGCGVAIDYRSRLRDAERRGEII